jgi:hypothetical protein
MVFCCLVLRAGTARSVVACSPGCTRSLRPPWSGVSTSVRRTTPNHLRAEEVARPWTGRPGNRAIKGLAVRRPRDQAGNQARPAWLTPATPSEQPDDSVRDPSLDQIRSRTLPPSPTPTGLRGDLLRRVPQLPDHGAAEGPAQCGKCSEQERGCHPVLATRQSVCQCGQQRHRLRDRDDLS